MRKTNNLYGVDIKLSQERQELMEGGWEYRRMKSMLDNIKPGDVVFDVGAEQGDMSVIMAKKTGKIVLFEPSPMMWPHIKENFIENGIKPLYCYVGFVSDVTDEEPEITNYDDTNNKGFPECAYDEMTNVRGFRHLHEEKHATKQITLDDYCARTGIYPVMVTIDVEGSEYNVLEGMKEVMNKTMPTVYISIHHDFLHMNYGKYFNDIAAYFNERGYRGEFLGHDHESHFVFYKKSLFSTKEII